MHLTVASGSSSTPLLPTPDAAEGGGRGGSQHPDKRAETNRTINLSDVLEHVLPTPKIKDRAKRGPGATGGPDLGEAVKLLNSPTVSEGTGVGEGRRKQSTLRGQVDNLLPTPKADDGRAGSPGNKGSSGDLTLPSAALALMPTPDAQMGGAGGRSGDPDRARDAGHHVTINEVAQALKDWGPYEPAIRRWERVLGREAPWATEPSPRSKKGRLAPRFVEWMMGWPLGWVTAIVVLSRNAQLKILGNGVVPQQAEAAVRFLLTPPRHREPKRRPRKALRRATPRGLMKAAREAGIDG